jgi:putative tricarboxylic transport membrane protein
VLALVLGDQAESAFRQSMLISQGSLRIFFSNWLVGSVMALGVVMLFWPLIMRLFGKLKTSLAAQGAGGR